MGMVAAPVSEAAPVVVVADPIDAEAMARLSDAPCQVIDATGGGPSLQAAIPRAWALIVRSRTKVSAEMIGKASSLRLVARAGVGVDNIDVRAASAHHVRVVNAPTAATTSVAELTIAFYLLLARDLVPQITTTKQGEWIRGQNRSELAQKMVGFIGYGRIAREVARRLEPFDVRTCAYDPYVPTAVDRTPLVGLDAVLTDADFVSLHAAATDENRHLMNAERLARMKPGAFLINVARGALVDEVALLAALESGHLGGAALDVFEVEPPTRRELLRHPRVIPTPHLGASTREAQRRAGLQVVEEVVRALHGEPLTALVNPEVAATP
jgi:D-3-phosphoglycerate dehydrogenase / 2-oxoglutarate reductase